MISACCILCLSMNRRTVNVYNTNIQQLYEKLADFKIKNECWMCYICHTRLRQCHRLQQLAIQTRGLVDDICVKKINNEEAFESLLELTIFKRKNISITHPSLHCTKPEPDLKTELSSDNTVEIEYTNNEEEKKLVSGAGCNEDLLIVKHNNVLEGSHHGDPHSMCKSNNNSTIHPSTYYIKQEPDVKTEPPNDDGSKRNILNDIHEYSYDYEENEQLSIKFEDPILVSDAAFKRDLSIVDQNDTWQGLKEAKLNKVKLSESIIDKCVQQSATEHSVTEDYLEVRGEQTAALYTDEQSIEKAKITQKMQTVIRDKGVEKENTNDCEGRDHASKTQSGCHKKPFNCDVCKKTFSCKSELLVHFRSHTGEKPYTCDICQKKYTRMGGLNKHKKIHTGEKPFSCDICQKNFTYKTTLIEHFKSHTGEKPFGCDVCQKRFFGSYALRVHMGSHNVVKSYFSCHICSKQFLHKSYLNIHIKKHLGHHPFSCNICSKKFLFKSFLNAHLTIHSSDKPFGCDICPLRFKTKSSLKLHCKIHAGDKQFCCEFCSKMFFRKTELIEHTRSHTGEKPHRCSFCQKGFARKKNLKLHLRIHTGEKPYSCDYCLKKFNIQGNFKKHKCRNRESTTQ